MKNIATFSSKSSPVGHNDNDNDNDKVNINDVFTVIASLADAVFLTVDLLNDAIDGINEALPYLGKQQRDALPLDGLRAVIDTIIKLD